MEEDCGRVACCGDTIQYSSTSWGSWELPVPDVGVVAEFTNQNGPFLSDHFFILVRRNGEWHEVPTTASGFYETVSRLALRLGFAEEYSLVGSTDFASRILWPDALKGRALFCFAEVHKSWRDRILHFYRSLTSIELTPEVKEFLNSRHV